MPRTEIRGGQIGDTTVGRSDLNITTTGEAVTRRIVAGTNINLGSTGVDTGTGDVTINAISNYTVESATVAAPTKATPVDADLLPITDSAASNVLKNLTWANLKATLKTYFDSLTTTLTNKTLTSPVINAPTGIVKADVGLANVDNTSDVTERAATATLTNKTITAPTISGTVAGIYTFGGTPTFPSTVVLTTGAQTLVSKTLTSPVISTISNTGTITLPVVTDTLVGRATTDTLTNKTIRSTTNIFAEVTTITSSATPTPTGGSRENELYITAQAAAAAFSAPTGTAVNGNKLTIRILDSVTARALTWNAVYRSCGATLPATTVISKTTYIGFRYNSTSVTWDCVSVAQQA